jgi:hypothetical protein
MKFISLFLSKYKTFNDLRRKYYSYYSNKRTNPLILKPLANNEKYLALWHQAKLEYYPEIVNYLSEYNIKIPSEWIHELALYTQVCIKESKINYQHGFLLYKCLSNYILKNKLNEISIVEIGTARGFSALCMAKAIKDHGIEGKILTLDILPNNFPIYWNSIGDNKGKRSRVELLSGYKYLIEHYIQFIEGKSENILRNLALKRINLAFIDGNHFYENVLYDGNYISKNQSSGDIIVFDDYNTSFFPGVVKAADEICLRNNYSKKIINSNEQRGYLIAQKQ